MIGQVSQIVMQPTSFCNLDCRYCYLPDRASRIVMGEDVLRQVLRNVFSFPDLAPELLIVWSLGEPLSVPVAFYRRAMEIVEDLRRPEIRVSYHFQTNGVLLTDEWCAAIKEMGIALAVSIDGPAELHDAGRTFRNGRGSHHQVMRGVNLLRRHGIRFGVISVVSERTLDAADRLFDFYEANGIESIGLNIEEIDGINRSTSLDIADIGARFRSFLHRMFVRFEAGSVVRRMREYRPVPGPGRTSPEAPGIVSVAVNGDFTVFGPELLGCEDASGAQLALGNLRRDRLDALQDNQHFRRQADEVAKGVTMCRTSCTYFAHCGGGPPSNKFFETGTFAASETRYCRLACQAVFDVNQEHAARRMTRKFGAPAGS